VIFNMPVRFEVSCEPVNALIALMGVSCKLQLVFKHSNCLCIRLVMCLPHASSVHVHGYG